MPEPFNAIARWERLPREHRAQVVEGLLAEVVKLEKRRAQALHKEASSPADAKGYAESCRRNAEDAKNRIEALRAAAEVLWREGA